MNSQLWIMQTNSVEEKRLRETAEQVLLSQQESFYSVSPDILMWKRDERGRIFIPLLFWSSLETLLRPGLSADKSLTERNLRNGGCMRLLCRLPPAASSTRATFHFPATRSLCDSLIMTRKRIPRFHEGCCFCLCFMTNISIVCVIYSTILAKLSTVYHHLNDLKWSFLKAM